jgi:uncharacterized delta-60 repeat protein
MVTKHLSFIRVGVALAVIAFLTLAVGPLARLAGAATQGDSPEVVAAGLDTTFGGAGKVSLAIGPGAPGNGARAEALAIQQDGKIVVAGSAWQPGTSIDFAVARFNLDGSLDQSFGAGGKVATDFFGMEDEAQAVAIQPDGKILVAGRAAIQAETEGVLDFDFALARYKPDGTLDQGFGSAGKVTTHFADGRNEGQALVLQPDGKIVVAGLAPDANGESDFALARYGSDGSLDSSFGAGGTVRTDFFGDDDAALAITIQPDGKLIAAGEAAGGVSVIGTPNGTDFALARYNPNGSLDSTFGKAGKVTTDFLGANDVGFSVTVLATGKIVVAGTASHRNLKSDIALARYNPDGTLDTAFGTAGLTLSNFPSDDAAFALAVQPDGKLVVAGSTRPFGGQSDFGLVRFNGDGTLDQTFGTGGRIATDFFGQDDAAFALGFQSDGKLVAAGATVTPTTGGPIITDFAIARYNDPLAQPDFALSFNASTITVMRGQSGTISLSIDRTSGFTGAVTVTAPDTSAIKVKLDPSSQAVTGPVAVFNFKIKRKAQTGSQALVFTGQDDSGRVRTATLTMIVQP